MGIGFNRYGQVSSEKPRLARVMTARELRGNVVGCREPNFVGRGEDSFYPTETPKNALRSPQC
jgi:hypothetical protein